MAPYRAKIWINIMSHATQLKSLQITIIYTVPIAVLEYNGSSRWNYVNPVVKQINAFQEALKEIIKDGSSLII